MPAAEAAADAAVAVSPFRLLPMWDHISIECRQLDGRRRGEEEEEVQAVMQVFMMVCCKLAAAAAGDDGDEEVEEGPGEASLESVHV